MQRHRLDRFISRACATPKKHVRLMIAQGRISVDGEPARSIQQVIDQFSVIQVDGRTIQDNRPCYVMINKPMQVVSATQDPQHMTVRDLLDYQNMLLPDLSAESQLRERQGVLDALHIVGRLDYNSTGLLLMTNNGDWSHRLTEPAFKVPKRYRVTLEKPITEDYIEGFERGFYFDYEGITTAPAQLTILSDFEAQVLISEGRYHQIKRMFGRFRNKVLTLHREAIGALELDVALKPGEARELTSLEVDSIFNVSAL